MSVDQQEEEQYQSILIELTIESWRFSRLFVKVANKLDAGESSRYISQLRYFQKKIDDCLDRFELTLVNLEGQPFEPGMAATALNLEEFAPDDRLVIDQMIEPILMGKDGLRRQGSVLLRKV